MDWKFATETDVFADGTAVTRYYVSDQEVDAETYLYYAQCYNDLIAQQDWVEVRGYMGAHV